MHARHGNCREWEKVSREGRESVRGQFLFYSARMGRIGRDVGGEGLLVGVLAYQPAHQSCVQQKTESSEFRNEAITVPPDIYATVQYNNKWQLITKPEKVQIQMSELLNYLIGTV